MNKPAQKLDKFRNVEFSFVVNDSTMEAPITKTNRFTFNVGTLLHVAPKEVDRLVDGSFVIAEVGTDKKRLFRQYRLIDGEPCLMCLNPKRREKLKVFKLIGRVVDAMLPDLP